MDHKMRRDKTEWMLLGEAADHLGVHFTTLRRWSDASEIPCFKTPGGWRRYKRSDLDTFLNQSQEGAELALVPAMSEQAKPEIIREIKQLGLRNEPWYGQISQEHQQLMARSGRKLIGALMQYASRSEGGDAYIQQGKELAEEYGQICQLSGLSEIQTLQTFVNIRHSIVDSFCEAGMIVQDSGEDTWNIYRRVNNFLDTVMLTMLESFQTGSSGLSYSFE